MQTLQNELRITLALEIENIAKTGNVSEGFLYSEALRQGVRWLVQKEGIEPVSWIANNCASADSPISRELLNFAMGSTQIEALIKAEYNLELQKQVEVLTEKVVELEAALNTVSETVKGLLIKEIEAARFQIVDMQNLMV